MNGTAAAGLNRLVPTTSGLASSKAAGPRHLSAGTRNTAAEAFLPSEEEGGERRERTGALFTLAKAGLQSKKSRGRAVAHAAFLTPRARRSPRPAQGGALRPLRPLRTFAGGRRRPPTAMVDATPARA